MAWPNARMILTTRPYATKDVQELIVYHSTNDQILSVEPMDYQQTVKLIEQWHKSYENNFSEDADRFKSSACKERLLSRLSSNTSLRTITNNPLICSLICFVNLDRDGFVPDDRGELYTIAADALLERRDRERGIAGEIVLLKHQKQKIIGYVSEYFWMRESTQVSLEETADFVRQFLPSIGLDESKSTDILISLSKRSHILRSPSEGYLDFSHKTFSEFFLARRLIDLNLKEKVFQNWHKPNFRFVLLFAFSLGTPSFINDVIELIVDSITKEKRTRKDRRYKIIVLQSALTEAHEVSPEHRKRVSSLLDEVLPPKSMEEAESLAYSGEAIFEAMSFYAKKAYAKYWKYCAVALVNSFDNEAVFSLSNFAKLGDETVDEILVNGLRFFEGDAYGEHVLSHCKTIRSLTINDWYQISIIRKLGKLKHITIRDYIQSWDEFSGFKNYSVETIEITRAERATDLSVLMCFPNLRELRVNDCFNIVDFTSVGSAKKLRFLELHCPSLKILSFLDRV